MKIALYINGKELDLFDDEDITINSSVSKIEDITKIYTDTSNTFSVPATDKNNATFKHFYNANLINDFDARKLVRGAIYLNGLLYKSGNFKLNKVILKEGLANSYSVDFYGLLTKLKDSISSDKLTDLDFTSENFDYNYTNVVGRLTAHSLIRNVEATLLSYDRYVYNSDSLADNTEEYKNIANNNNSVLSGFKWQDVNFSMLNLRIIEAIESKYNLSFSRDFFGTQAFSNLYLLLNSSNSVKSFNEQIVFDIASSDVTLENDRILLSTNKPYVDTQSIYITIDSGIIPSTFTVTTKSNGVDIHEFSGGLGQYEQLIQKSDVDSFENLTFHISSDNEIDYNFKVERNKSSNIDNLSIRDFDTIFGEYDASLSMPDIKVIDYLSGLFKAYKLVVIPINDTEMHVDTLTNYYKNGIVRDVTEYVDFKEFNISVGSYINEISYKFQESKTILGQEFEELNSIGYGDLKVEITDENNDYLEGESIDFELPFENMVYEKLTDVSKSDEINIVYGLMQNDSQKEVTVKPHLHYINNVELINPIKIIENSTTSNALNDLNSVSHTLGYIDPQFSTVFGREYNEYNGVAINNTLYTNYHKDFIEFAFSKNKRTYNYELKNVPLGVLKNISLNDVLLIKSKPYRIDSMSTNLQNRSMSVELINDTNVNITPIKYFTTDVENVYASSDLPISTKTINKNYTE